MAATGEISSTDVASTGGVDISSFGEPIEKPKKNDRESEQSDAVLTYSSDRREATARRMIGQANTALNEGLKKINHPDRYTDDPYLKAKPFGPGFWFVFLFTASIEILDMIFDVIEAVGSVTVILALIAQVLIWCMTVVVVAIQWNYFYFHRIPGGRKGAGAGIRILLAAAVKAIPVIGPFIPMETAVLYLVRRKVNKNVRLARAQRSEEEETVAVESLQLRNQIESDLQVNLSRLGVTA